MRYPFASLPENLAVFCTTLRQDHRFLIGPRELQEAACALETVALANEREVRDTLRTVLSSSLEDVRSFDRAFDRFFHAGERLAPPPRDAPAPPRIPEAAAPRSGTDDAGTQSGSGERASDERVEHAVGHGSVSELSDSGPDVARGIFRRAYSPLASDGAPLDLGPADRAWRDAAAALVRRLRAALSRRWRPSPRGQRFDLRRTLRRSLHNGGDVIVPYWRVRRRRQPRFVTLIDGSRSMAAHVGPALQAAVALASVTPDTDAFTFSTALRQITRDVRRAAAGERRRLHLHQAWGGGTAIGACLREFVHAFGNRLLGPGTIVMIASDGLDIGNPAALREAMATLSRRSAAIVWLNPLLGTVGYEPTAVGMRTARPFVTTLASVSSPARLQHLSRVMRVR